MNENSGITVGNKTLEAWLLEQTAKETTKTEIDKAEVTKKDLYHSPRYLENQYNEKSGKIKMWPQSEVNKLNYKETIKMFIEKNQSLTKIIIAFLISGTVNTCESIARALTEAGRPVQAKNISNSICTIYKSYLGHFIERKGKTDKYSYRLNRYGMELTPEQLYSIYTKVSNLNPWNITEIVPKLKTMGYTPPEGSPPEKKKSAKVPATIESTPIKEVLEARIDDLLEDKKKGISKDVDININVRITFSFQ